LPAHAGGAVRLRARPDRVRRADGHDARATCRVREVLELRRGRAPFGPRARRYAPRPYEIVVLSDHGQTQGATFKQRNGYGLDELVERSLSRGEVAGIGGGDEQGSMVGNAAAEATGQKQEKRPKNDVSDKDVVVLGSGNLGLIY